MARRKPETEPPVSETNPAPSETSAAVTETPAVDPGRLEYLALDLVIPTPDNVRVVKATDPKVKDLADSMKRVGVLQPVVARPHPNKAGHYDLRAGARRHMAAGLAGLETIPVMVREMDDLTAKAVTAIENMERDDLSPWEQAKAVALLMEAGFTVEQAAAKMGKSPSFIMRRASLCRLTKSWQKVADEDLKSWPAAYWERIAVLPAEVQERVLREEQSCCDLNWIESVRQLEQMLAQYTHELVSAPFPLDWVTGSCLACVECQKRSGLTPGLFDIPEDASAETIRKKDRCLDAKCWETKLTAWLTMRKLELFRDHGDVLMVGHGKGMVEAWKVEKCKPGTKGAVACLGEDGSEFWGKTKAQERETEPRKTAAGAESRAETGSEADRQNFAEAFATARLAKVIADEFAKTPRPATIEPLFHHLAACSVVCAAQRISGHGPGCYQARQKLEEDLGLVEKSTRPNVNGHPHSAERLRKTFDPEKLGHRLMALAFFDFSMTAEPGGYIDGKAPEVSPRIRELAASGFVIPREFLEGHLRADVYLIAKRLGVDVGLTASKSDMVQAVLDAKLPAGALTPELAKAFGVKCSKPGTAAAETEKPAKKAKGKKAVG